MAEMNLFDAMYSARALRRYKPDPIPDDVMTKILQAATQAPAAYWAADGVHPSAAGHALIAETWLENAGLG